MNEANSFENRSEKWRETWSWWHHLSPVLATSSNTRMFIFLSRKITMFAQLSLTCLNEVYTWVSGGLCIHVSYFRNSEVSWLHSFQSQWQRDDTRKVSLAFWQGRLWQFMGAPPPLSPRPPPGPNIINFRKPFTAGVDKLWLVGQIQPVAHFSIACNLRTVFTFLKGWNQKQKKDIILWHVRIIWNSNFSVQK